MLDTILQIASPYSGLSSYNADYPFVWSAKLTKDSSGYGPYYSKWRSSSVNTADVAVISVQGPGPTGIPAYYERKVSLQDCIADDQSFFWDDEVQVLYTHYPSNQSPMFKSPTIGTTFGFSYKKAQYIDKVQHRPRISSVPKITQKVDKFQVGKMQFVDQTISLINSDGGLDGILKNPLPGVLTQLLLLDTDTEELLNFYTGFIASDISTWDTLTFKLQDSRRKYTTKIPVTVFEDSGNMSDDLVGDLIPEGYGSVIGIPAFALNGESTGDIQYRYATDGTVLSAIRVQINGVWIDHTGSATFADPLACTFTLPRATAVTSAGALNPVVVDVTLRGLTNPADILADMNSRYLGINYDDSGYNTTEWESEKAKLAPVYLYMNKNQEIFKYIESLQNGSNLWFVYLIEGDGRRTIRVNDISRPSRATVRFFLIKDDQKSVERDFSEFSSKVTINYGFNYQTEKTQTVVVDDFEEEVLNKYKSVQENIFESLLTNEADAREKGLLIAENQKEVRPVLRFSVHATKLEELDLKLYDVLTIQTSKPGITYDQAYEPESIELDKGGSDTIDLDYPELDIITFDYKYSGRLKKYPHTEREYWGNLIGQIIEIAFDPSDYTYTITVREIDYQEVIF